MNRIGTIVRRGGYPGIPVRLPPHVPGADIIGYIESAGPGTDLSDYGGVGDLVLVSNVWGGCGSCRFCRAGMEDHCPSWTMPGFHVWGGGYGELVRVPARALLRHLGS